MVSVVTPNHIDVVGVGIGVVFYQQPRGEIYARVACLLQVSRNSRLMC